MYCFSLLLFGPRPSPDEYSSISILPPPYSLLYCGYWVTTLKEASHVRVPPREARSAPTQHDPDLRGTWLASFLHIPHGGVTITHTRYRKQGGISDVGVMGKFVKRCCENSSFRTQFQLPWSLGFRKCATP